MTAMQGHAGSGARGQHTFEYAAALAVVAAALLGMAIYVKRGISGRFRDAGDSMGGQYAPRQTTSDFTLTATGVTTTTATLSGFKDVALKEGKTVRAKVMEYETTFDDTTERTGREDVGPMGSVWE